MRPFWMGGVALVVPTQTATRDKYNCSLLVSALGSLVPNESTRVPSPLVMETAPPLIGVGSGSSPGTATSKEMFVFKTSQESTPQAQH